MSVDTGTSGLSPGSSVTGVSSGLHIPLCNLLLATRRGLPGALCSSHSRMGTLDASLEIFVGVEPATAFY